MIDEILSALQQASENPAGEQALLPFGKLLAEMPGSQTGDFLDQLIQFAKDTPENWPRPTSLLLGNMPADRIEEWLDDQAEPQISELYALCPSEHILRGQLLTMLAAKGSEPTLNRWCDLLCNDPPLLAASIAVAFQPLTNDSGTQLSESQLNRLVAEATGQPVVGSAIYELTNLYYRQGNLQDHPLSGRTDQLVELLGSLVSRMAMIEEGQLPAEAQDPDTISQTVQNSVALIIAITDTLSLLKVESAIGKFNQALELKHRRIQVESAAALTRLEQPEGKQKLLDLAAHPVVRPRVLAYAKELGLENDVSLEHTGPIATAETHLALWLAQPEQMGLAPTEMKLLDQRELYWPSYEEPVSCYLFSFEYGTGENAYRNIGLSGPLTHAFVADITTLPIADQYSAFAGWQTMSDEIFLVPIERAISLLAGPTESLKQRLETSAFDEFEIKYVASFFGEYVLVVDGIKNGVSGTLVLEKDEEIWIPAGNPQSPIDTNTAFDIWSGRKLLTNFNPAFS